MKTHGTKEIWKPVEGYRNYEVSNKGNVRHIRRPWKNLSLIASNNGYIMVHLYQDGFDEMVLVHRMVAQAFIYNDDPEHKSEINHKNYNKHCNHVDNLEWVSSRYNKQYSKNIPVYQIDRETDEIIAEYSSLTEAAALNGWHSNNISTCINGHTKTAYKYKWRKVYADNKQED